MSRKPAPFTAGVTVRPPTPQGEAARLNIGYDRAGQGTAVLLVHGNFASHRWWREQLADPPAGLDLIAPDLPGFAHSDRLPGDWPPTTWVSAWADTMAAFLATLGIERAGVVGHSLGGALAQALAVRHPELVSGLLLIGSAPPGGFPTPEEHYAALRAYATDRNLLAAALAAITPTRLPSYMDALVDDALAMGERHFEGNARALAAYDLTPGAAQVTVPVTVLHGGQDLLVPAAAATSTAAAYQNARLVTWEDVGHSPPLEAPDALKELLLDTFGEAAA